MKLYFTGETNPDETRVALLPEDATKLVRLGAMVEIEAGLGKNINISDSQYEKAGAHISPDSKEAVSKADMVLRISIPSIEDIQYLKDGCIHLSYMDPFNEHARVKAFAEQKVNGISLEMIPRTTIAQKMDVLSSQANLAGYAAVILAAASWQGILPMMMTPAGTLAPARVFIIGAGVAGLQAIATAKRLGARVSAFDVRPEAGEQIKSLGADSVTVELGETRATKDGYAKQMSEEQLAKQREVMAKQCAQSDIVITTAQVFGKKAPVIVTNEMLDGMKPGSIVVDMAVSTGGNVEASQLGEKIERNGVMILGYPELQRHVPLPASRMFSSNLYNFIEHFWDKDTNQFVLNKEDEIIQGCLITSEGHIVHERIREIIQGVEQ
jgi:NAD(P) transhydrogenase subunit alpha